MGESVTSGYLKIFGKILDFLNRFLNKDKSNAKNELIFHGQHNLGFSRYFRKVRKQPYFNHAKIF